MKLLALSSFLLFLAGSPVFAAATSISFSGAFPIFYAGQPSGGDPPPVTVSPVQFTLTLNFDSTVTPAFHHVAGTLIPDSGSGMNNKVLDELYGYSASSFTSITFTTSHIAEMGAAFSYTWTTAELETFGKVGVAGASEFILFNSDITTTVPTSLAFYLVYMAGGAYMDLRVGDIMSDFVNTGGVIAEYSFDPTRNVVDFFQNPGTGGSPPTIYNGVGASWTAVAVPEPSGALLSLAFLPLLLHRRK